MNNNENENNPNDEFPVLLEYISRVIHLHNPIDASPANLENSKNFAKKNLHSSLVVAAEEKNSRLDSMLNLQSVGETNTLDSNTFQREAELYNRDASDFQNIQTQTSNLEIELFSQTQDNIASQDEYSSLLQSISQIEGEILEKLERLILQSQSKDDNYLLRKDGKQTDKELQSEEEYNIVLKNVLQRLIISSRLNWASKKSLTELVED